MSIDLCVPRLTLGVVVPLSSTAHLYRHPIREKSYGCFVHRQQPVKMFRLSSGTVCLVCVCKREREGGGERDKSFIQEREKLWCGSCAVWMFRPSSAAGQDVSSFVRHPVFSEYVCVCVCVCKGGRERERERERRAL